MHQSSHVGDFAFLVLGAVMPSVGTVLGMITAQGLPQTIFLAAVGATVGWLVKVSLDYLKRKVASALTELNKKKEEN